MGEEMWVLRYKPTRFSFLLNYFLACVFLIILFSLLPFMNLRSLASKTIFFGMLCVIVYLAIEPEIEISRREYILTPESIVCYGGILSKKSVEIPYREIRNLEIEQNLLGKLIEYGNVLIEGEKEKIKMVGINNPEEVHKIIKYKIGQIKLVGEKEESEEE